VERGETGFLVTSQKFCSTWLSGAFAPIRKEIKQILHSTFGYVQDDKAYARNKEFSPENVCRVPLKPIEPHISKGCFDDLPHSCWIASLPQAI
jgi:hypothetical protein